MRSLMVFGVAFLAVWAGTLIGIRHRTPKPRVSAPTTRYHGYALNREAIARVKKITVLISNEGFGPISRGTGVLLDANTVLTCAHVVSHLNDEILVHFYPGYYVSHARVVYMDSSKDLALLQLDVSANAPAYAKFSLAHYDGEPITIIGNILGSMKWFVGYGIISGENERDLYTDGLVLGGDSGGPWINEAGEIVAISDWGLQMHGAAVGINGGIAAHTVHDFLEVARLVVAMNSLQGIVHIPAPVHGGK